MLFFAPCCWNDERATKWYPNVWSYTKLFFFCMFEYYLSSWYKTGEIDIQRKVRDARYTGAFTNLGLAPFLKKVRVDDSQGQAIEPNTGINLFFASSNDFAEKQVRPTEKRKYPAAAAAAATR